MTHPSVDSPATDSHVFVVYGTQSLEAASRIGADVRSRSTGAKLYYLVLFDGNLATIPENSKVWMMSPPPSYHSEWTRPFAIASWFRAVLDELKNESPEEDIVAYVPHPFELPGNHFTQGSRRIKSVDLLPDGLINYSDYSLCPDGLLGTLRYSIRIFLRVVAAACQGLVYHPYFSGHITQFEHIAYARSWSLNPRGFLSARGTPTPVPEGPKVEFARKVESPCILFLDQELDSLLSARLEAKCRQAATDYVRSTASTRILYKAHPRGQNRCTALASQFTDVEDVSAGDPAEILLHTRNVREIVGFYSTPLVVVPPTVTAPRRAFLPDANERGVLRRRRLSAIRTAISSSGADLRTVT